MLVESNSMLDFIDKALMSRVMSRISQRLASRFLERRVSQKFQEAEKWTNGLVWLSFGKTMISVSLNRIFESSRVGFSSIGNYSSFGL